MSATIFCQHCGKPIDDASRFCRHCGQPQPGPSSGSFAQPAGVIPAPTAPVAPARYGSAPYAVPVYGTGGVRYGGFWIRFLAYLLDSIIVSFVTGPLGFLLGLGANVNRVRGDGGDFTPDIMMQAGV